MPGFDGTGPSGQGPLTGGGRGYCIASVESERNILTGYAGMQEYPMSSGYPYSFNYRKSGMGRYNYSFYDRSRTLVPPQKGWNYVRRGYRRFLGINYGRGIRGRGRRF